MIELRDVYHKFQSPGAELLFEGINLSLNKGELAVIIGPKASGKTTLLKILAGELAPSRGHARVQPFRAKTHFLRPSFALLPDKSVIENVALPLLIAGHTSKEALTLAQAKLEQAGIYGRAQRLAGTLSSFETLRAQIARALVAKPTLILCDLPLDDGSLDLLATARNEGSLVVVRSESAESFSKRQRRQLVIENRKLHEHAITRYPTLH